MEEHGLFERHHGQTDHRAVLVRLTDAGQNVFREMEQMRSARLRALLKHLSEEELAGFLTGLRAMEAAPNALGDDDATPASHGPTSS